MDHSSRIVLRRSSEFMNRARSFKVVINNEEKGLIKNGATEDFGVASGMHTVKCKIDWCSSNEFVVNAQSEKTTYLVVKSALKYYWHFAIPLLAIVLVNLYFVLSHIQKPNWFNLLLIAAILPCVGYIFYYTFFNRKKYLIIESDSQSVFTT